jgi:hypothetical protein
MLKADIRSYRRWHRDAALRARRAGPSARTIMMRCMINWRRRADF